MFKNVIVRKPGSEIGEGITSAPELGKPDYQRALKQHDDYIETLRTCGVRVTIMEELAGYPDACFIEDTAICTKEFAVITNPGAESRNGETKGIEKTLSEFYNTIETISTPGTLEGGDVMMVRDHFYIGLSNRTNEEGGKQLIGLLANYGYTGSMVEMEEMLHLKTGLSYLEDNILLVAGEFIAKPEFDSFQKILIPEDEGYAANCIRVNDHVIVPSGYPKTKKAIEEAGLNTLETDTSEYQKLDGGLSCLSLRF